MLTEKECEVMNALSKDTLMEALGMRFVPTDDDVVVVKMPISKSTRQHMGIVHGGAYLALAETVAGAGSLHVAGLDAKVCGIEVSGNHVQMSPFEGYVTGFGSLISAGHTIHVWNVDVKDEEDNLLSTIRVVNRIEK
jgi:uncharacterized protein (TIGR00369 family)